MKKSYDMMKWTPEMVRKYWDYESQFSANYFANTRGPELAHRFSPFIKQGARVLDYGCGPGYLIEHLLRLDAFIAGLDSSAQSRQKTQDEFGSNPRFLGSYDRESLIDSGMQFDVITVLEVIEHLYDDQLTTLLIDLKNLLLPGGVVIFTTPNDEDLSKKHILCPVTNELFHRWQHVRSWSAESLESFLSSHDYTLRQCYSTNFNLSLRNMETTASLGKKFQIIRKIIKQKLKPGKKQPHLVAIACPEQ